MVLPFLGEFYYVFSFSQPHSVVVFSKERICMVACIPFADYPTHI